MRGANFFFFEVRAWRLELELELEAQAGRHEWDLDAQTEGKLVASSFWECKQP